MFVVQTVRLYPSPTQQRTLLTWMYRCRRVWNHFLEHRIKAYKRRKESPNYAMQCRMLTKWRENDERLRAVPVEFQRDALSRLQKAFDAFFRRLKTGETPGFPRFKGRDRWHSMNCSSAGAYVRNGMIAVPKIGLVRCRNLRPVDGTVKGLRIVKRADRWFAQLLIDDGKEAPAKVPVQFSIGIDMGLESFATLSNGEQIANPRWYRLMQRKLRRAQRTVCRRKKRSKRREKAKLRVAKLHMRAADARKDFVHKLSKRLVSEFDLIAVEKLAVKNMVRGRFAKSINDAAWSHFRWCLSYKAANAGKTVVEVDPRGTSQECSGCGQIVRKTLRERQHKCDGCGLELHRDHNAALNILSRVPPVGREFTHGETPLPGRRKAVGKGRRTVKSLK